MQFWEYNDKLFANHRALSDAKLREIAEELGLDSEKFAGDLMDPAIQQTIANDMREAGRVGVRGTPTIFLNGKRVKNRSLQVFQAMIDSELKKTNRENVTSPE